MLLIALRGVVCVLDTTARLLRELGDNISEPIDSNSQIYKARLEGQGERANIAQVKVKQSAVFVLEPALCLCYIFPFTLPLVQ